MYELEVYVNLSCAIVVPFCTPIRINFGFDAINSVTVRMRDQTKLVWPLSQDYIVTLLVLDL